MNTDELQEMGTQSLWQLLAQVIRELRRRPVHTQEQCLALQRIQELHQKVRPEELKCVQCGGRFKPNANGRRTRQYCSEACRSSAYRRRKEGACSR